MPMPDLDPDGRGRRGDRMVAPDRRTGVDEVLHPGRRGRCGRLITWVVMPRGIDAWPWRMPSKIQISPKAIRRSRRAAGSG